MNNSESIASNNESINFASKYPNIEKAIASYSNLAAGVEIIGYIAFLWMYFISNGITLISMFFAFVYAALYCYSLNALLKAAPLKRLVGQQLVSVAFVLIVLAFSITSDSFWHLKAVTIVFVAIKVLATLLVFLVLCSTNKKYSLFNGLADDYCQFYMSCKAYGIDSPLFEEVENRLCVVGTIKEQSNYELWRSSLISLSVVEEVQKMNGIIRMKRMIASKDSHFFAENTIKFIEGMNNTKQYSNGVEESLLKQFK